MKIAILLLNKGRGSGEVAREHVKHLLKQRSRNFNKTLARRIRKIY